MMKRKVLFLTVLAMAAGIAASTFDAQTALTQGVLIGEQWLTDYDMDPYVTYGNGHLQEIHLTEQDAAVYPQLAQALEAYNTKTQSDLTELFHTYCEGARTDRKTSSWEYEAAVETDIYVRRADEEVFSFMVNEYSYSGGAHGYYSFVGHNYRTATGEVISLSDVVKDDAQFRQVVEQKLRDKYGDYLEPDLTDRLESYAVSGGEYEYDWRMDGTGIYVIFNPYAIAPYAAGAQQIHIGFEEYPALFTGEFHKQEGAFVYQICPWLDDTVDPDGDGERQTFAIENGYDEYSNMNSLTVQLGEKSATIGNLYYYDPLYFLFHLEDGRNYLYADLTSENDSHAIETFDLNHASPVWVGETYAGFGMLWDMERDIGMDQVPTDPDYFVLNTRMQLLSTHTGQRVNRVGASGMPQPVGTSWYTANAYAPVTLKVVRDFPVTLIDEASLELPAEEMTGTEGYIRAGESVTIWRSDGRSMLDLQREDGSAARVYIDTNDWPHTINGEDENSYFEQLFYAG